MFSFLIDRKEQGGILFRHPEVSTAKEIVYPVFIPFAGCPTRCLFCAQGIQTGKGEQSVASALAEAEYNLVRRPAHLPLPELAFYGGTFTALPQHQLEHCLHFASAMLAQGKIRSVRCSTRPDCITPEILQQLAKAGVGTIELGIQSFAGPALKASQRGYSPQVAMEAAKAITATSMRLGIQLMPGMPGQTFSHALEDVRLCTELMPDFVRLYPCLVLKGTDLEQAWLRGEYQPWEMGQTVSFLAEACLALWRAHIAVARIGLAPENNLDTAVLAGAFHPALGSQARALALHTHIRTQLLHNPALAAYQGKNFTLHVPQRYSGQFWGHAADLEEAYTALGLCRQRIQFWNMPYFAIQYNNASPVLPCARAHSPASAPRGSMGRAARRRARRLGENNGR